MERYEIVWDGGSLGNPGHGYGSYRLRNPRGREIYEKLDFADLGDKVTNNQAEYLTLIRAMERLRHLLGDRAKNVSVLIQGDSQLVINQVTGSWKVKNAALRPLHLRATALLPEFGAVEFAWHPRANSVAVLGH
ncbi:MAG TPA: ribonuclease HI family protein [Thermomicrobiales bacterium]|nr:ribonuclease HI family protein [Thermomicrobiales bacterium]